MKGFQTIEVSEEYRPAPGNVSDYRALWHVVSETAFDTGRKCLHPYTVFFMPNALKDLNAHIHWGEFREDNLVEQTGYLLGNVYRDIRTDEIFAVVRRLVPVTGIKSTSVGLEVDTEASMEACGRERSLIEKHRNKIRRIGWYHTHPGPLGIFMSPKDMETQQSLYFKDWQFAVVLNPQRKIWKAFHGRDAAEAECIFLLEDRVLHKFHDSEAGGPKTAGI